MIKRVLSLLMTVIMIVSCPAAVPARETEGPSHQIEKNTYPLHFFTTESALENGFPLYFVDGAKDLPFTDLKDWTDLVNVLSVSEDTPYVTMSVNNEGDQVTLLRDNGSSLVCDFSEGTLLFDDYLAFQQNTNKLYIDIASITVDKMLEGETYLRATDNRLRRGSELLVNLKKYDIPMIMQDGKYLLPLQTISSLSFSESSVGVYFNQESLISSQSFSCANLVPWAFKEDGRVTLLGKTSGGGSCVVRPLTTAWGTSFKISGSSQISFVKNGAYYDVDQGVEPDFTIMDYNHFYDREALTKYISELF